MVIFRRICFLQFSFFRNQRHCSEQAENWSRATMTGKWRGKWTKSGIYIYQSPIRVHMHTHYRCLKYKYIKYCSWMWLGIRYTYTHIIIHNNNNIKVSLRMRALEASSLTFDLFLFFVRQILYTSIIYNIFMLFLFYFDHRIVFSLLCYVTY